MCCFAEFGVCADVVSAYNQVTLRVEDSRACSGFVLRGQWVFYVLGQALYFILRAGSWETCFRGVPGLGLDLGLAGPCGGGAVGARAPLACVICGILAFQMIVCKYLKDSCECLKFWEPGKGVRRFELLRGSGYGPVSSD